MHRRSSVFVALLVCVALLAACGGSPSGPTSTGSGATAASAPASRSNTDSAPAPQVPNAQNAPAPKTAASTAAQAQSGADAEAAQAPPVTAPAAGGAPSQPLTDSPAQDNATTAGSPPGPQPGTTIERPPSNEPPPSEQPYDSTFYKNYGVNPFVEAEVDPLSTFAMDIDTASYGVMRRYLRDGNLPDPNSVRVEEYLNNFNYQYPQPEPGSNFAIYTESAPSPWGGTGYEMVQIGIQGRAIAEAERLPTSLTFVIDVSGSMERENRLETVKEALTLLVAQMREDDKIGIVTYGDYAQSVLPPTSGAEKKRILEAIYALSPQGSTNVEAGLDIGFAQADEALIREGSNQILLCSDGVANNGVTDPAALVAKYKRYTSQGIKLSTYGFGMGNYNDVLMEELANNGNGFYSYIDSMEQAEKLFVNQLVGTLQLIARDAKIQVEFNPAVVQRYRLIGYENRDVADQDFRNDTVDAGEVGAGHSVTALYEIKRTPGADGEIATVRIRYNKIGTADQVAEEQQPILTSAGRTNFTEATPRFQLAVSVAQYAELLRYSRWTRGTVLEHVRATAQGAARAFEGDLDVSEFIALLDQAARLAPTE